MQDDAQLSSLKRGLRALALMNRMGPMTTSQLARELAVPRTTADRLFLSLASEGYIERVANGRGYRLTPQVCALSAGFSEESWITHVGTPMLFETTKQVGWPFAIAAPVATHMIVRVTSDPATALWLYKRRVGSRAPILNSSSGLVFLAFLSPEERNKRLAQLREAMGAPPIIAREETHIAERLDRIRRDGYSLSPDGGSEHSLAVPILVNGAVKACALMMYMGRALDDSVAIQEYLPRLKEMTAEISRRVAAILIKAPLERLPEATAAGANHPRSGHS